MDGHDHAGSTWSTDANWLSSLIGTNTGNTADFNQVDLPADTTVNLTTPVTIGNLIFGDTETSITPAGWTLANNSTPANILTLAGTAPTITVNALGAGKGVTISTVIAGVNGLTKTGSSTLTLGAVNTYTTGTTISGGTLKLGIASAIATGPLTVNSPGVLDLNGFNYSGVSQFNGDGTVDNTSASAKTLTIGNNNVGGTFSGVIQNSGGGAITLQKFGTGNIVLSGPNTYTGQTKIGGGTTSKLSITSIGNVGAGASSLGNPPDATSGTINLGFATAGGSLVYTGAGHTTDRVINLANTAADTLGLTANGSGPIVFSSDFTSSGAVAKTLTLNGTSTQANTVMGKIVDNSVANTTSLTKAQAGTWVLGGANTYTGPTAVNAGKLVVNGSIAAASTVTVANSATLGGNGTISGAVTVNSGGTLAPGTSIGTLTLGAPPVLGGTVAMEINATDLSSDKLNLTSGVFSYGGTLALTVTAGTLAGGEVFDLFDFAGTSSGSFAITTTPTLAANLNWWTGLLASEGKLVLNRAPTAQALSLGARSGIPVSLGIIGGKHPPSDPDGNPMTVTTVSSPTVNGATVSTDGINVTYTAPSAYTGPDSFTYTVSDNRGGSSAAATVSVDVASGTGASPNVVSGPTYSGGKFSVTFAGIPGFVYTVEYAEGSTAPPWLKLKNVTAGTNGLFVVEDTASQSPSRFYRTVYPSY